MYTKADVKDIYFLSSLQEGMLFTYLLDDQAESYLEQLHFSISGDLDLSLLERTVNAIVARYDALRTVFIHKNVKRPVQVVLKPRDFAIKREELTHLSAEESERYVEEWKQADRRTRFELTAEPPMRMTVLKRAEDKYEIVWTFHHIILDGWSVGILLRDFLKIYRAFRRNRQPVLGPTHPFGGYIKWLEKQNRDEVLAYWEQSLRDYEEQAGLPKTREGRDAQAYALQEINFTLPAELTRRLERVAKEQGVTLSTVFHAVWGVLLQKYNNARDVVFGSVVSGRPPEVDGVEKMVGMFINSIPVRVSREDGTTFAELLRAVREESGRATGHDYVSLSEIQANTVLKQDLINHVVVFENYPLDGALLPDKRLLGFSVDDLQAFEQTDYDFNVVAVPGEELAVRLGYNSAVYDRSFVEGVQKSFALIAAALAEQPHAPIRAIALAMAEGACEGNRAELESDASFAERFEKQAERTPDSIAVAFEGKSLTYRQLNEKANQLARVLRERGAAAGRIVGLLCEPSLETVVGILGVLKSGAGYLPIDSSFTQERIAFMLSDSGACLLLTQPHLLELAPGGTETLLLSDPESYKGSTENLPHADQRSDVMYMIYTSGTTGQPKGVLVTHGNMLNYAQWFIAKTGLSERDSTALTSSFAFDLGYTSLFPSLASGAALHLLAKETYMSPDDLLTYVSREQITYLKLTPSLYTTLVNSHHFTSDHFQAMRVIVLGGETINLKDLEKTFALCPHLEILNHYGPTETTVGAIAHLFGAGDFAAFAAQPTIGRPVDNASVCILDRDLNLLPAGVPGEICIGGLGVTRGYLNRDDLNADKFIAYSIAEDTIRLYRTGDRGRVLPDGTIEFLGRTDDQVKIRGYRIEPGEVEHRLNAHDEITDAVVVGKRDEQGMNYLCAYFVATRTLDVTELRAFLADKLPDYMIPSFFMQLDELPLTSNGKVNKRELPEPERGTGFGTYEAPRNRAEEKLAAIWQDVLGAERIGVHDDFFLLGGHSLKAMMLVSRISKEFGVEVPLKQLFAAPTVAGLAAWIATASEQTRITIQPVGEKAYYRTSSAQKRVYALTQRDPDGTLYNMPHIMRVEGRLDAERMEKALRQLIERHESLRTSFHLVDGEIVQKIEPQAAFQWDEQATVESFIRPFDLAQSPLLRAQLLTGADGETLFLLDIHHIISDGVSSGILFRELMDLYAGRALPPVKLQYKEYAEWQHDFSTSDELGKQKQFWTEQLAGELPVLNLPTDQARPSVQSFAGDFIEFALDGELYGKLKGLSRATGTTLFTILLGAYKLTLAKYTGQEDIIVGTVTAGRPHADLQGTLGMFVNTLALRSRPTGSKTVAGYLQEVQSGSLDALEHQEFQFEDVLEALQVQRDVSRNPIFDTVFVYGNMDIPAFRVQDLTLALVPFDYKIAKFDMTLSGEERPGAFHFRWEYCTALFKQETIERFARHYQNVLREMADGADKTIAELSMISAEESRQILLDFNNTATAYPKDRTIPQLFEEQVRLNPERTALVFEKTELTYRELNERANRLAHELRGRGVGAETLVAMIAERSLDMIVGIMGILKAGGAYLPIDPEYADDRIRTILEDSGAEWLVSHDPVRGKVAGILSPQIRGTLWLDELNASTASAENLEPLHGGDGLAYVMYTSGSTGKPKGNLTTHANITRVVCETNYIDIAAEDTLLQLSTYAFDGSTFDIFGALLNGAKLVLLKKEVIGDIQSLSQIIADEKITVFFVTTALFNTIVDLNANCLRDVRKVLFGGERVSVSHVEKALAVMGTGKILHVYGPTESTVYATWYPVDGLDDSGTVPIGYPLANTELYVLNPHNQLQPVGAVGEICIAGDGLARGYLNRPELTAEKFVDSPFREGAKMYRTGDLGRWLPDGAIEFYGRIDHQVKIRGYRVELGEIEAHLLKYEGVKEAIVIARDAQQGYKYLCAYLVPEAPISLRDLRDYLAENLPEYMIPSFFVEMEQLPLTPNGKVNQRELPEPDQEQASDVPYEAPRTKTEAAVAALWNEVLDVANPSIHDDFFALGGHSLKAMVLLAKIRQHFQVEMSLKELFELPTIKALAATVETAARSAFAGIAPAPEQPHYPASSAQKRMYALAQFAHSGVNYNIPNALILEGQLDAERLQAAFDALVARHEALRTSFETVDGEIIQRIHPDAKLAVEALTVADDATAAVLAFVRPFDLSRAPLIRAGLGQLSEDRWLLVTDTHHIVSDGVSSGILTEELLALYAGQELDALSLHYKDYAVWQQSFAASEEMRAHEAYWLEQFAGEIPVLQLPTDFPRPALQDFEGDSLFAKVDGETAQAVKRITRETGATLYMVLMSAYNILLSKYSGQEDVVVGTVTAGRQHADLQSVVGMFVGTLALRNYPEGTKSVRSFIDEVKGRTLDAFEHGEYPLEQLVERLQIPRDASRNPIFDTVLVLENVEFPEWKGDGLTGTPYVWEHRVAKFDLSLVVAEEEEELGLKWEYRTNLFARATVERIHRHFLQVLREMAGGLDRTLGELEMIAADEQKQLLEDFQPAAVAYPDDVTVLSMFEAQARKTPESTALILGDQQLTYRELDERANALARVLRERGVAPDQIVGMMLERSLDMAVAILGIWKAGGAYLPIDPTYPEDRIAHMLEDSRTRVLLTEGALADRVAFAGEVFDLAYLPTAEGEAIPPLHAPHDLAYIIYTSGTTGKPKGVAAEHRNIANTIQWRAGEYGLNAADTVLQLFSYSFDGFLTSFFTPLASGSRVVFLPEDQAKDPIAIARTIAEHGVTHFISVPSLYAATLEVAEPHELASLRIVTLAGEKMSRSVVEKSQAKAPQLELVNEYGPTENSVATTIRRNAQPQENIPIGKPVANTRVAILDKHGKLVPLGGAGELCITGRGIVRGYLHRPELTAEKFAPHPYYAGERMYRTGDLARWTSDGEIEFLGRIDHQIKVRGYRIEAGEIENELLRQEAVRQAVVVGREDERRRTYLCAYLVTDADEPIPAHALRAHLGRSLPDYMIPSYFVELEQIPLTANGKVDLSALPEPNRESDAEYVAPRTDAERLLADLWSSLLGAERVGIRDHFFELGGDSLKAIALVSSIYKEYGVRIDLTSVFQNPTVEQLAATLSVPGSGYEKIEPVEKREAYPVSSAQKRMFILHLFDKGSTVYNIPVTLQIDGPLDRDRLAGAIAGLAERHELLRTTFAMQGRDIVQIVHEKMDIPLIEHAVSESELEPAVKAEILPFDLTQGPLLRAHLFRLADREQRHVLLLDLHHIIGDGSTAALLVGEFQALYDGRELPPQAVQYKDFAVWQERFYQSESFEKQEQFWLDEFATLPPELEVPLDKKRPAKQSFAGDGIVFETSAELTASIKKLASTTGTTLYMVLLAGYNVLLHKYANREDIVVGCGIAGRNHPDVAEMAGMFINTLPLRNRPQAGLRFLDFLAEVRTGTLQAFEHQDYPFDALVDKLKLARTNDRNPLFQTVFELQNNAGVEAAQCGEVAIRPYNLDSGLAKFDFTLFAAEKLESIQFYFNYATSLFERETAERMAQDFVKVLEAVAGQPDVTLGDISVAPKAKASKAPKKQVTFEF